MNICVVGGAGYVGSKLVPHLLKQGHMVTVLDTFWYGDHLPTDIRLLKIKGDIRDITDLKNSYTGQDAVIHLACVSNDPSFDMNPGLGKSINYDCFKLTLDILKECEVPRFIYASSSSVYGVSDLENVTEDASKNPLTDYSKYKLMCEEELIKSAYKGTWTILRPATVCGYAPRLRLDVVVNTLTIHALVKKEITLFGHDQKRPNIYVNDMVRAYDFILNKPSRVVNKQIYNVGFENKSLYEIALLVQEVVDKDVRIVEKPVNDPRSYHIDSSKIASIGFETVHTIKDAIESIMDVYLEDLINDPLNNPDYYNIKSMKQMELI